MYGDLIYVSNLAVGLNFQKSIAFYHKCICRPNQPKSTVQCQLLQTKKEMLKMHKNRTEQNAKISQQNQVIQNCETTRNM